LPVTGTRSTRVSALKIADAAGIAQQRRTPRRPVTSRTEQPMLTSISAGRKVSTRSAARGHQLDVVPEDLEADGLLGRVELEALERLEVSVQDRPRSDELGVAHRRAVLAADQAEGLVEKPAMGDRTSRP
jgi:hypothetical protein